MATPKLPACTEGPKHRWTFVRNVWIGRGRDTARGRVVSQHLRGLYSCPCGCRRYGTRGAG